MSGLSPWNAPPPTSPESLSSNQPDRDNKFTAHISQHPFTPPRIADATHFNASSPTSPQSAVFTPHSAPLMSAQTSHQGQSPASELPLKHFLSADGIHAKDEDTVMEESVSETFLRTSSKHRLSDEETDSEPHKRQRTDHNRSNEQQELVQDGPQPTLSFGPLYKLGHTSHHFSRPHSADDLFSLYSLSGIAASVARNDPVTGAKINAMKKTYKEKVKAMAISGKNRANKTPDLSGLVEYPDEEWHIQKVMGKELIKRDTLGNEMAGYDPAASILAKLDDAVNMQPGRLPAAEAGKWDDVVVEQEENAKDKLAQDSLNMSGKVPTPFATGASLGNNPTYTTNVCATPRPKRRGTESRHYGDEHWDGYDATYGNLDDDGSLDGEEDGKRGNKRRKKVRDSNCSARETFGRRSATKNLPFCQAFTRGAHATGGPTEEKLKEDTCYHAATAIPPDLSFSFKYRYWCKVKKEKWVKQRLAHREAFEQRAERLRIEKCTENFLNGTDTESSFASD